MNFGKAMEQYESVFSISFGAFSFEKVIIISLIFIITMPILLLIPVLMRRQPIGLAISIIKDFFFGLALIISFFGFPVGLYLCLKSIFSSLFATVDKAESTA